KEETKEEHYTLHTVVAGDTLYSVSMKYYQTRDGESFIRSLNGLTSNELTPGQLLKIPPKAEIGLK
ncbi:MAG: LysM peptidoglycan-binding domain-containing protein, partial [Bacillaceae bacterium]